VTPLWEGAEKKQQEKPTKRKRAAQSRGPKRLPNPNVVPPKNAMKKTQTNLGLTALQRALRNKQRRERERMSG